MCSGQSRRQSSTKGGYLRIGAATDADATVLWGDKWHADEDTVCHKMAENRAGKVPVTAAVDSDKVRGRRKRRQTVRARDLSDLFAGCRNGWCWFGPVKILPQKNLFMNYRIT